MHLFAFPHLHLFFVPRGLFLYVETEALLDTNSFSSAVKRNSDILTFVKVPRQPLHLKNEYWQEALPSGKEEFLGTVTLPRGTSVALWLDAVHSLTLAQRSEVQQNGN